MADYEYDAPKSSGGGGFVGFVWTMVVVVAIAVGVYVYWAVHDLPAIDQVVNNGINPSRYTQVLGRNGQPILSHGKYHHKPTALKQISPAFVDSLIATEDRRFYNHFGVDPLSIVRAVFVNLTNKRLAEGGSTLTQQLARNVFLSNERSLRRKVREAFLAIKLEQELSKDQILEMYVNNTYFGEGAYGIEAASEVYFNKKPAQLEVHEAALLAGLPQAPSAFNPYINPNDAKARRNEVLGNLYEIGKLTEADLKAYQAMPVKLNEAGRQLSAANRAPFFNQYVMNQVLELFDMDEQSFWQSGMKIHTTLEPQAQALATRALVNQMALNGMTRDKAQAALVSIEPDTGAIIAYVGGKDYTKSQFDRASAAVRSPGSLFKVFTYAAAVEKGYLPSRVYLDEPIKAGEWIPKNYDGKHHGYMTIAQALMKSNNIVAVKVMNELGAPTVVEMAQRLGINTPLEANLALTLGSSGVTVLDMTSAMGTLANKGVRSEPYAIEKIVDRDGNVIYEHYHLERNVLDRRTVDVMVAMLQNVVTMGTGGGANIGRPVAGKTGTSDEHRDGWFVGFTPDIVTGVWVGNDDNAPLGATTGGGLPATIWAAYMRPYLQAKAVRNFDLDLGDLDPATFLAVNLDNLSEQEINSTLAMDAGRALPGELGDPLLEGDPLLDPLGVPQTTPVDEYGNPIAPPPQDPSAGNEVRPTLTPQPIPVGGAPTAQPSGIRPPVVAPYDAPRAVPQQPVPQPRPAVPVSTGQAGPVYRPAAPRPQVPQQSRPAPAVIPLPPTSPER